VDVLRLAADEGDRSRPIACAWHVMDSSKRPIQSSCGLTVDPTSALLDPQDLDYVVVVGGLLTAPAISEATADYLRVPPPRTSRLSACAREASSCVAWG
jgi:transcriptional regulator GlxA family with amidase domain